MDPTGKVSELYRSTLDATSSTTAQRHDSQARESHQLVNMLSVLSDPHTASLSLLSDSCDRLAEVVVLTLHAVLVRTSCRQMLAVLHLCSLSTFLTILSTIPSSAWLEAGPVATPHNFSSSIDAVRRLCMLLGIPLERAQHCAVYVLSNHVKLDIDRVSRLLLAQADNFLRVGDEHALNSTISFLGVWESSRTSPAVELDGSKPPVAGETSISVNDAPSLVLRILWG